MWRLLILEETNPYINMALEEVVLKAVEEGRSPDTLRFWRNTCSAIIGCSQNPGEVLKLEKCRLFRVSVVRRFTGGGAVYQDSGNLNWTFVCRRDSASLRGVRGTRRIFERFSSPVTEALKGLGVKAEFRAPNAIYMGGGKVSGMAMYIKRRSVLCHGTLLIDSDQDLLNLVLSRLKEPVKNVNDEASPHVSVEEVMGPILEASERCLDINFVEEGLSPLEEELLEHYPPQRYDPLRLRGG